MNYIFLLKYIFLRLKHLLSWWHFKQVFLEKKVSIKNILRRISDQCNRKSAGMADESLP